MIVKRSMLLPCPAEQSYAEVLTSRLLVYVASPLVCFIPIEPESLPVRWEDKEYLVSMRLFGLLPLGRQVISISRRDLSSEVGHFYRELRDNGHGALILKWDHLITIEAAAQGCIYTDRVEVQAGLLTPFVWLFVWIFYRHRQCRWKALADANFHMPSLEVTGAIKRHQPVHSNIGRYD